MRKRTVRMIVICFCIALMIGYFPVSASDNGITIDASHVEGIYSDNILGTMFEWGHANMNGAWAEMLDNRNFEMNRLRSNDYPVYDTFNRETLNPEKWIATAVGDSAQGTVAVNESSVSVSKEDEGRFGLLSKHLTEKYATYCIETVLLDYTGVNAMMSILGNGTNTFNSNVEFGVENNVLKIYGDGVTPWSGAAVETPVKLRIEIGPLANGKRDLKFYANDQLVHSVLSYEKIQSDYQLFLYGWGAGTVTWDMVSMYKGNEYEDFGRQLPERFHTVSYGTVQSGSVSATDDAVVLSGVKNARYGLMSNYITNSGVDWTEIECSVDNVVGTNALLSVTTGEESGDYTNFVEFGVEDGKLVVYTESGRGNWKGASVALPGRLKIQVTPYYANGRDYKFYWNDNLVYSVDDIKDAGRGDFRVFLYGYSTSVTTWNRIDISQEHFIERYSPHFKGTDLPVEWCGTLLAGENYGSYSVNNSQLKITGGADSRYGLITAGIKDTDIKTYKISVKLDSYSGINGLIHLRTGSPENDFTNYVEYGIENGKLKVFTPEGAWTGDSVSVPATLDMYVTPYDNGRDITFVCNGRPVYELNNYTFLGAEEFKIMLYGYGSGQTAWDFCTYYPVQGWDAVASVVGGEAGIVYDESAVSGQYVAQIKATSNLQSAELRHVGLRIESGKKYSVSFWAKALDNDSQVNIRLEDSNSNTVFASSQIAIPTGNVYEKYSTILQANGSSSNAALSMNVDGIADVYLDQVSMMPIDDSDVVYGGWRKDFVDSLVELNTKSLRWPGGCLVDWYDWEDGIGERDLRPPLYFAQWDAECFNNDVGIDEFMALAEALSLTPVINVNYGSGTPEAAANWVEYCNGSENSIYGAKRVQNGHAAAYNIRTWEIRNETWGWWEPGTTSGGRFATDFVSFRDAMYAKDNTICFIGEGEDGTISSQAWNEALVSTAGDKIDQIGVHYYFPKSLPQGYKDDDVYYVTMAAAKQVEEHLKNVRNVITENSNSDIKVAVTEYNAMYFNSKMRRTLALEAALQTAGLLTVYLDDPGLTDNNFYSCLNNFWDGAAIKMRNGQLLWTPNAYVLDLFTNHRGEVKIESNYISPTFSTAAMGNMPAQEAVPYVDVLATRSADGQKLYLSVLNRSLTNDYSIPINIQGASLSSTAAKAYTLTGDNVLSINTWENPTAVQTIETTVNVDNQFTYSFAKHSYTVLEFDVAGLEEVSSPIITGKVVDEDGVGLSNVVVTTADGYSTYTDTRGYYTINAPYGEYVLNYSKDGYESKIMKSVDSRSGLGVTVQQVTMHQSN